MDSITQAALGAAIGEALLGKRIGGKGAVLGAIIATIPDLDVALLPFYSSLERISIHRGLSHSILFSIVGALAIGYILSRIKWTKRIDAWRLILFSWLALFTHILLDTFTTYGTQLYLPFSDSRVSFDSINIVDPIYTLPLILGLFFSIFVHKNQTNRSRWNYLGLIASTAYLLFTLGNKMRVENSFKSALNKQEINFNKILTVPVGMANINWYGVAKTNTGLYIGKLNNRNEHETTFEYFPSNDNLLNGLDDVLVDRLKWFSQGFYTVAEHEGKIRLYNMQCDMQGVRTFGDYKAPTAFYFEISPQDGSGYDLTTGMHPEEE